MQEADSTARIKSVCDVLGSSCFQPMHFNLDILKVQVKFPCKEAVRKTTPCTGLQGEFQR